MERSGPDDARDDAWDDAWSGASDDDATSPSGRASRHGHGPQQPGRPSDHDHDPLSGLDPFRGFGRFEGFDPFDPADVTRSADASDNSSGDAIEWYPPAPLPAHERTWRHPSELGLAAWQQSEPPVSIGRGLLVATGAIGSALGVAVLYLLLPAGGPGPAASPTATSSTAFLRPPAVSLADLPAITGFRSEPADSLSVVSAPWFDEPGNTLPSPDTPSTVLVMAAAAGPADAPVSVAIAIEGAPYVVTTANAIGLANDDVHLVTAGSKAGGSTPEPMAASVVSILGDLAFLEPSSVIEVVSFAATAPVEIGQPVTVLGDEPTVVAYIERSVPELDPSVIVEGTPVVDGDGALVALCTVVIDADGAHVDFVPIHESTNDANPVTTTAGTVGPAEPAVSTTVAAETPPTGATTSVPTGDAPAPGSTTAPARPPSTTPTTSAIPATPATSATPAIPATPATPANVTTPTTAPAPTTTPVPTAWVGLRFDGAPTTAPLTITGVVAGSPAMAAGLMVGERLVAIDGDEVRTVADVIDAIRASAPGDVVRLTLAPRVTASSSPSTPPVPVAPGAGTPTATTTAVPTTTSGTRNVSLVLASFAPTV